MTHINENLKMENSTLLEESSQNYLEVIMDKAINNINEADKEQTHQDLQKTIGEKEEKLLALSSQLSELQAQNFEHFSENQKLSKNLINKTNENENLKMQNATLLGELSQDYLEGIMDKAMNNINQADKEQIHQELQNKIDEKDEILLTISSQLSELQAQNFD